VKIKDSQNDWFRPEDWTLDAVREQIGAQSIFRSKQRCEVGQPGRLTKKCHCVKEKDPALVGKAWAALASVDVDTLGISTYNQLFDKQVRVP
jgi:hypothetical protein